MRAPGRTSDDVVSLFIVSEVRIHREGIAAHLSTCGRFRVDGIARSTADGFAQLTEAGSDVMLLDVSASRCVDFVRSVRDRLAPVKIVVFGVEESDEEILAFAESGVAGYAGRDASMDDLIAIIMSVVREELICSPRIAATLFKRVASLSTARPNDDMSGTLTGREREVLVLLREGLANKEIAQRLNISNATVKNHVHNLLGKLQITKRTQALKVTLPTLLFTRVKSSGRLDA